MVIPEKQLIEAAQKDPSFFAELYEQNFESVYAFIITRVRNRNEAQDLTSDVFHRALAGIGEYEWRGVPFASWLFRIASNAIADHFRRVGREQNLPESVDPVDPATEDTERRTYLFRFVNELPADQRKVLFLRFADQKTVREIAQELHRTEGAIKQLQFRALRTLRSQMRNTNG
jgi:RNA polymerase sigma-70 factor, ECF subfamily